MSRYTLAGAIILLLSLALTGCQTKTPPPPPPPPTAADFWAAGKKAFAAGDCATALPALAEVVRRNPEAAEAQFYFGLCAARQQDGDRAEIALRRAAALSPGDPRPLEALGILQYDRRDDDAARESLTRAAGQGSANPQTYYYLGNLAMRAGDCPAALVAYRKAMAKDPAYAPAVNEYRAAVSACAKAQARPAAPPASPAPVRP